HADARLRLERAYALAGLDEEIVDAVVEAPGAGGVLAQRVNGARGEAGLFHELAPAAVGRVFAGIDEARRQLPGERFERRAVLPHDRDFPTGGERDDRDVIGLLDRVIGLRRRPTRKLHLARDDAHPGRHRRGAARAYARPFHVLDSSCPGLTRASIERKHFERRGWIAGSSPAMTVDGPMIVGVISAAP